MDQREQQRLRQIGASGGTVNTNGMSSTQKQQTDAAINQGRQDANKRK